MTILFKATKEMVISQQGKNGKNSDFFYYMLWKSKSNAVLADHKFINDKEYKPDSRLLH